jgi:hypothetical protein
LKEVEPETSQISGTNAGLLRFGLCRQEDFGFLQFIVELSSA